MSVLLEEIRRTLPDVATEFENLGIIADAEIQSMTRDDLNELFPGSQMFKKRKAIDEIIHRQRPRNVPLRQLKALIPNESLKDALGENGVLCDYIPHVKDILNQVENVQKFLDAHIDWVEKHNSDKRPKSGKVRSSAGRDSSITKSSQSDVGSVPGASSSTKQREVKFHSVVSGETFGSHHSILAHVRDEGGLKLVEANGIQDCQIIIVFCPIMSRIMSDVDDAMRNIPDDKPVILVLMHHTHDVLYTVPRMSPSRSNIKTVLDVNVLYHDTAHGLLKCEINDRAFSEMHKSLLKLSTLNSDSADTRESDISTHGSGDQG